MLSRLLTQGVLLMAVAALAPARAYGHDVLVNGKEPHGVAHSHDPHDADEPIESLRDEIADLREDIHAYQERTRMTDILGAIGYIVGITGAAYYYMGVRRERAAAPRQPENEPRNVVTG